MTKLSLANHDYLEETILLKDELEKGFIVLGERLKKIRDERLFADEYEDFESFVSELKFSRATAYKYISVYEKYVLLGGIAPEKIVKAGWGNISMFTGLIETKEQAQEVFDKVWVLDRPHALQALQEMKSGISMSSCKHDWQEIHMRQCNICQAREKIYQEKK